MAKTIIYKKGDVLGNSVHESSAMQDILNKDKKHILNQKNERSQLFRELKKYRDNGITKKELKGALAGLKYGSGSHLSVSEINALAQELNLGSITKKHLLSRLPMHNSKLDRANHEVNYSNKNLINKETKFNRKRKLPNDDIINFEIQGNAKKIFGNKYKKLILNGDMTFEEELESVEFVDENTGKKFIGKSSQLKRPDFRLRSQASLRGRGWVAGRKS